MGTLSDVDRLLLKQFRGQAADETFCVNNRTSLLCVFAGLGHPRISQAVQLDQVLGDIASSQFVQQPACAITSLRSGFMSVDDNAIWQQVTALPTCIQKRIP